MNVLEKKNFLLKERSKIPQSTSIERLLYFFLRILFFIKEFFFFKINRNKLFFLLKKKDPLISVITPTYNRSSILMNRAVKSVLNQTYKNIEYIIVGDGCTDDTEKKINSLNNKKINFYNIKRKIYYKRNIFNLWFVGPVRALNYALSKCKGDWIARIDDDEVWKKNHLKQSLYFIKKKKLEFTSALSITKKYKKNIKSTYYTINKKKCGASSTFFFVSYLKYFKFNLFCWMKKNNRVNDVDLFDRITSMGVKTGLRKEYSLVRTPRPGEETVGLDQIILKKKKYKNKYLK